MALGDLLAEIDRELARYGQARAAPASEATISYLLERAGRELGAEVPPEFLALVRDRDGLEWNGLVVHGSDRLVEANLEWRDDDRFDELLVLAEGNLDLYVVHIPTGEHRVMDRVPGNLIARCDSFESLLETALEAHR